MSQPNDHIATAQTFLEMLKNVSSTKDGTLDSNFSTLLKEISGIIQKMGLSAPPPPPPLPPSKPISTNNIPKKKKKKFTEQDPKRNDNLMNELAKVLKARQEEQNSTTKKITKGTTTEQDSSSNPTPFSELKKVATKDVIQKNSTKKNEFELTFEERGNSRNNSKKNVSTTSPIPDNKHGFALPEKKFELKPRQNRNRSILTGGENISSEYKKNKTLSGDELEQKLKSLNNKVHSPLTNVKNEPLLTSGEIQSENNQTSNELKSNKSKESKNIDSSRPSKKKTNLFSKYFNNNKNKKNSDKNSGRST